MVVWPAVLIKTVGVEAKVVVICAEAVLVAVVLSRVGAGRLMGMGTMVGVPIGTSLMGEVSPGLASGGGVDDPPPDVLDWGLMFGLSSAGGGV